MCGSTTLYADSCVQIVDWSVYIQDVLQTLLVLVGWMLVIELLLGQKLINIKVPTKTWLVR